MNQQHKHNHNRANNTQHPAERARKQRDLHDMMLTRDRGGVTAEGDKKTPHLVFLSFSFLLSFPFRCFVFCLCNVVQM